MTSQDARTADAAFQHAFEQRLRGPVLARFEEASRYAVTHGQHVSLESLADNRLAQLELTLLDPQGARSLYRISGDLPGQHIVLEQQYANGDSHRQEIALAALNDTVIDTELAAFFSKAAGLKLDYLAERHPAGFW